VPDIIIFMFGIILKNKESAKGILEKADVVLSEEGTPVAVTGKARLFRKSPVHNEEFSPLSWKWWKRKKRYRHHSKSVPKMENPLPCCQDNCRELKVDYQEVGKTALRGSA